MNQHIEKEIDYLKKKKYEEGITLITCTGDRNLCMSRCFYYILRQIKDPLKFQWIICDDSKEPYLKVNWKGVELFQRKHIEGKVKSFLGNLREALLNIKYNKVIIIEDDDWYSPDYIQLYSSRLDKFQLIGEGPARYYNVQHQLYRIWGNDNRASLCQTAFRAEIAYIIWICTKHQSPFVDDRLWNKDIKSRFVFKDACHCVGIKGMPGRKGIGSGHRPLNRRYKQDKDFKELEKWIGVDDTDFYRDIFNKSLAL